MTGMIADLTAVPERMAAAAGVGYATATDLADWLVRSLGIPFREAHHLTGRLVAEAERRKCGLEALPLDAMHAVEPRITKAVYDVLGVDNSVRSRVSFGGTAPERVAEQVAWWRARL
jgi:argininosuccinate lyase